MANLLLRINYVGKHVIKTLSFSPKTTILDACRFIHQKNKKEYENDDVSNYGLFLPVENGIGIWLNSDRTLDCYMLRNQDLILYKIKLRQLRVKMVDDTIEVKTVDGSKSVGEIIKSLCQSIGITNYEEYGLVRQNVGGIKIGKKPFGLHMHLIKSNKETRWIQPSNTLDEECIDEKETVFLQIRFQYTQHTVNCRDPVQVDSLYNKTKQEIITGIHPVTESNACLFAFLQLFIEYGPIKTIPDKIYNLTLPPVFCKIKRLKKRIFDEFKSLNENKLISVSAAKALYINTAKELPTYDVKFFLVKEKKENEKKLIARHFGVSKNAMICLDMKTNRTIKTWPLTTIKNWCCGPNILTFDFGDHSNSYYTIQTLEAEEIKQIIDGYIDIIVKKNESSSYVRHDDSEAGAIQEENSSSSVGQVVNYRTNAVDFPKPLSLSYVIPTPFTNIKPKFTDLFRTPINVKPKNAAEFNEFYEKLLLSLRLHMGCCEILGDACKLITNISEIAHNESALALQQFDKNKSYELQKAANELQYIKTMIDESQSEAELLEAINHLLHASFTFFSMINSETMEDHPIMEIVSTLMLSIADEIENLKIKAEDIRCRCKDRRIHQNGMRAVKQCQIKSIHLQSFFYLLVHTLNETYCPRIILSPIQCLAKRLMELNNFCDKPCFKQIHQNVSLVIKALHNLIGFIIASTGVSPKSEIRIMKMYTKLAFTDNISSFISSKAKSDVNILHMAYKILAVHPKNDIEYDKNTTSDKKLLAASKLLADVLKKLVQAATEWASNPTDSLRKDYLHYAIETCKIITTYATDQDQVENFSDCTIDKAKQPHYSTVLPPLTENDKYLFADDSEPCEVDIQLKLAYEIVKSNLLLSAPPELHPEIDSFEISCLEEQQYLQLDTVSQLIEEFEKEFYLLGSQDEDDFGREIIVRAKTKEHEFVAAVRNVAISFYAFIQIAAMVVLEKK